MPEPPQFKFWLAMKANTNPWCEVLYLLLWLIHLFCICLGADKISIDRPISGYQTIVSVPTGNFELGFFDSSGNSNSYFLGIWYRLSKKTIVWVANREAPMSDNHSYALKIFNGNLILTNSSTIWSTELDPTISNSVEAVLLDSGNLILKNNTTTLWQSFDYPTDTLLPGGRIGFNKKTNQTLRLISWKNKGDPAPGLFSIQIDPKSNILEFMWNDTQQYWNSGAWNPNMQSFQLLPEMRVNTVYNYSYTDENDGTYFSYDMYNSSFHSRFRIDVSGQAKQWLYDTHEWRLIWTNPKQPCDVYAFCGANGICNLNPPVCTCLQGFVPKSQEDWDSSVYSSGCVRPTQLTCHIKKKKGPFLEYTNVALPNNAQTLEATSIGECESHCSSNCSCNAYSYDKRECGFWSGDLLDVKLLSNVDNNGKTLYIRLPVSRSLNSYNKKLVIASVAGSIVFILIAILGLGFALVLKNETQSPGSTTSIKGVLILLGVNIFPFRRISRKALHDKNPDQEDIKTVESLTFDLTTIRMATDNFSVANKLGEGGFGEVYKGKLENGEVVAIKRLSKDSKQGSDEFKTEVLLAAKLQHRNLVKLLGFCLSGEEKILVYEYLPNNSLDRFMSDTTKRASLNWETRFKIIGGIAKGLLYLHEDSRLTIVHRDLKPSNILLDEAMNPKIADFGMAKLFGVDQTQDNTNRIVGTYGYMAPEYVVTGNFSVRSDVYAFGIIVLELVSGRKFKYLIQGHDDDDEESLLYRAWRLWNDGTPLEMIDPTLGDNFHAGEMAKCIQIGLLCVQEDASKRPRIASIVSSLNGESYTLSSPTVPRFLTVSADDEIRVGYSKQCASVSGEISESFNELSPR